MSRSLIFILAISLLLSASENAVTKQQKALQDFAKKHPEATLGLFIYNSSKGETAFEHNGEKNLSPASSLKALTTATALEILGPDYQFNTYIRTTGKLINKTLEGNLVIEVGGDPTFGSGYLEDATSAKAHFEQIGKNLLNANIHKINGQIELNFAKFNPEICPPDWNWEDMGNYYGAHPDPLSIGDNQILVTFSQKNSVGEICPVIEVMPSVQGLKFNNQVVAEDRRSDNAYIFGAPGQYNRTIMGAIPKGVGTFTIKGSMPQPRQVFVQLLIETLTEQGIELTNHEIIESWDKKEDFDLVYAIKSEPLFKIVEQTNIESINLFAELLLQQLPMVNYQKCGRIEGIKLLENYWLDRGLDLSSANLRDGSGLSRSNSISTKQLALVIHKMKQGKNWGHYKNSLPVAGKSGSIAGMWNTENLKGNLQAKSGYINAVRSYTGFLSKGKQDFTFSIIVNNYSCGATEMRKDIEALLATILD
ncbi:MAG: D-alanyl-D-alanine carboxypeptidase/D-alanyl-D-alanine-endopeptidase [Bacteroidetes bacterium]|nr:D-alanyl-D-alanine carboxypeptidase/D-alanyl-D-alanine-endopeptidase [Bacteroidota bacterium]